MWKFIAEIADILYQKNVLSYFNVYLWFKTGTLKHGKSNGVIKKMQQVEGSAFNLQSAPIFIQPNILAHSNLPCEQFII